MNLTIDIVCPVYNNYKSINSGLKLAKYVFFQALIHFNIIALLRWLPDMEVKYLRMIKRNKWKRKIV